MDVGALRPLSQQLDAPAMERSPSLRERPFASASMTMPRAPARPEPNAAQAAAEGGHAPPPAMRLSEADRGKFDFRNVDKNHDINADLVKTSDSVKEALTANLDVVAKRTFKQKLGGAFAVGVMAAVAIGFGIATGGAGLLVAGSILATMTARMSGDAHCAKLEVENAEAIKRGEEPPHKLPLGTNSLGNLLYKALPSDWDEDRRIAWAGKGSLAIDLALQAASGAATGLIAVGVAALPMAAVSLLMTGALTVISKELGTTPTMADLAQRDKLTFEVLQSAEAAERLLAELRLLPSDSPLRNELEGQLAAIEEDLRRQVDKMTTALTELHQQVGGVSASMNAPAASPAPDSSDELLAAPAEPADLAAPADPAGSQAAPNLASASDVANAPQPDLVAASAPAGAPGIGAFAVTAGVMLTDVAGSKLVDKFTGVGGVDFTTTLIRIGVTLSQLSQRVNDMSGLSQALDNSQELASLGHRIYAETAHLTDLDEFEMNISEDPPLNGMPNYA